MAPDRSQSSRKKQQQRCGDPVVSATLRQLQRLGVDVDEDLTESDRRIQQTVESSRYRAHLVTPDKVLNIRLLITQLNTVIPH